MKVELEAPSLISQGNCHRFVTIYFIYFIGTNTIKLIIILRHLIILVCEGRFHAMIFDCSLDTLYGTDQVCINLLLTVSVILFYKF